MKRAHFFLPLLFLLIISCTKKSGPGFVSASGAINNMSVIIDDQLWNGEIGDSIRNKFASPVIGLPQEEPLFSINQYPVKLLEGFLTNNRNIIVIKKEPKNRFEIVKDEYAKPQNVIYISGNTVAEILNLLEKHTSEMIKLMHNSEIAEMQRRIDTSLLNTSKITQKFNISIHIPSSYKYVLQGDKLTWLKKDIISGNTSILIYSVPVKCLEKNANAIDNIVKMRDSIGNLYIHGTVLGSKMITEEAYAPYLSQTELDGRKTYETKGTWELKDDFMSGPFINYAIMDKPNNRIIVIEGFCYAPSKEKRELVQELEAIIKSVKIN